MYKNYLVKKTGEKKVIIEEEVDDEEKYLEEEYELGYEEKLPIHVDTTGKLQTAQQL